MPREALTRERRNTRITRTREINGLVGAHISGPDAEMPIELRGDRLKGLLGDFGIPTETPNLAILDGSIVVQVPAERLADATKPAIARKRLEELARDVESGKIRMYPELNPW